MKNIAEFALEKLENINKIQDLDQRASSLQNLCYYLNSHQNKLKFELNYPVFWANLENLITQGFQASATFETSLNHAHKKILLYNRLTTNVFEADLISPQDLVSYLTTEDLLPKDRTILELVCSYSAIYLSLNFILNLPE